MSVPPPGDASFADAAGGVRMSNIGFAMTGIGVAAIAGGMYWYYKSAKSTKEEAVVATPWITPEGMGLAVSGRSSRRRCGASATARSGASPRCATTARA